MPWWAWNRCEWVTVSQRKKSETCVGFPGLGQLAYKAVIETDTNLVMSTIILSAAMLVAGNLFADILLKFADPRIEL